MAFGRSLGSRLQLLRVLISGFTAVELVFAVLVDAIPVALNTCMFMFLMALPEGEDKGP